MFVILQANSVKSPPPDSKGHPICKVLSPEILVVSQTPFTSEVSRELVMQLPALFCEAFGQKHQQMFQMTPSRAMLGSEPHSQADRLRVLDTFHTSPEGSQPPGVPTFIHQGDGDANLFHTQAEPVFVPVCIPSIK